MQGLEKPRKEGKKRRGGGWNGFLGGYHRDRRGNKLGSRFELVRGCLSIKAGVLRWHCLTLKERVFTRFLGEMSCLRGD